TSSAIRARASIHAVSAIRVAMPQSSFRAMVAGRLKGVPATNMEVRRYAVSQSAFAVDRRRNAIGVDDHKTKLCFGCQALIDRGLAVYTSRTVLDSLALNLDSELVTRHDFPAHLDPIDRSDHRKFGLRVIDDSPDQYTGGLSQCFQDEDPRHDRLAGPVTSKE